MLDLVLFKPNDALKNISGRLNLTELLACSAFKSVDEANDLINDFRQSGIHAIPCNLLNEGRFVQGMLNAFNCFNVSQAKQAVDSKAGLLLLRDSKAIDTGIIRLAAERKKAIALLFADLLSESREFQPIALRQWMFVARLCRHYDASLLVFSGANSLMGLRSMHDLKTIYYLLGYSREQAGRLSVNAEEILGLKEIQGVKE
ncbi:hypothetical protein HZB89_00250 [archaeon]|nr:hypothetical protein [archaeon]